MKKPGRSQRVLRRRHHGPHARRDRRSKPCCRRPGAPRLDVSTGLLSACSWSSKLACTACHACRPGGRRHDDHLSPECTFGFLARAGRPRLLAAGVACPVQRTDRESATSTIARASSRSSRRSRRSCTSITSRRSASSSHNKANAHSFFKNRRALSMP